MTGPRLGAQNQHPKAQPVNSNPSKHGASQALGAAATSSAAVATSQFGLPPQLHLGRLSSTQLSDTIAACAASGLQPGPAFLHTCVNHLSMYRLRCMRPPQLATVIRSLVELDYHPGADWLLDFDAACFTHHGPLDPDSVTQVLQAMARFPGETYRFPQAVYIKLKAHMEQFSFEQLAVVLQCLRVLELPIEEHVLENVGRRMAALLGQMDEQQADATVQRLAEASASS